MNERFTTIIRYKTACLKAMEIQFLTKQTKEELLKTVEIFDEMLARIQEENLVI